MTWKALETQVGLKIAGDLVARGASINKKTREAIARIQGDIPKVAIKRTKDENELNEYEIMVAMTSANPDLRALVEAWAEDTQFCWDGVAARLEWIALQSISLGKVTLTNENNNSVITEYDVDYQIDATQKVGFQTGSAAWNTTGAKPFSKKHHRTLPGDTLPPAEHGPLGQQPARVPCGAFRDSGKQGPAYRGKVTLPMVVNHLIAFSQWEQSQQSKKRRRLIWKVFQRNKNGASS